MKIGIDLVRLSRVTELLENRQALEKIFHPEEITDDVARLAGRLAAKEAYFKARGKKGDWLSVAVRNDEAGRPVITADADADSRDRVSLSITHEGDYAAAVVIIEENREENVKGNAWREDNA